MQRTLPQLKTGEIETIKAVIGAPIDAKRLADMGFVCGAEVEMVRPGRPCIVRIDGVCIALGAAHQHRIRLASP